MLAWVHVHTCCIAFSSTVFPPAWPHNIIIIITHTMQVLRARLVSSRSPHAPHPANHAQKTNRLTSLKTELYSQISSLTSSQSFQLITFASTVNLASNMWQATPGNLLVRFVLCFGLSAATHPLFRQQNT